MPVCARVKANLETETAGPPYDGSRLPLARNTFTARTRLLKVSTPFVEPLHVIISAGQRQTVQGQAAAA
jgi:hypothetical protein